MREYKKLQRLADEYLEQYNNTEFLEEMKGEIRKNAEQTKGMESKKRNMLWTFFASAASVLLIAVSLFVFLPQKNVPIEKHYTADHEETETIDLITLNNGLTKIKFNNKQYEEIKQYYDTFYNEILYYETEYVASDIENIFIDIVPNLNYKYEFKFACDKTDIVYGYTLDYLEKFTDAGGFYECEAHGQLDTGSEKVYFTYNGLSLDKSSNFVNLIKEIIKQK